MNVNKGNTTLNYVFGIFIVLNTIKVGGDLYARYKKSKSKNSCSCKR